MIVARFAPYHFGNSDAWGIWDRNLNLYERRWLMPDYVTAGAFASFANHFYRLGLAMPALAVNAALASPELKCGPIRVNHAPRPAPGYFSLGELPPPVEAVRQAPRKTTLAEYATNCPESELRLIARLRRV